NLLSRMNRELDADFALRQFKHIARFNPDTRSIEMHLGSTQEQIVTIRKANLRVHFGEGETIWTENSHKYSLEEVARKTESAGFRTQAQWIDREWPFAETLLTA